MSYRQLAEQYAAAARKHELDATHAPTTRDYMARLNAAKTAAIISQAYSALAAFPPESKVVWL